jgi:hypothetical protein
VQLNFLLLFYYFLGFRSFYLTCRWFEKGVLSLRGLQKGTILGGGLSWFICGLGKGFPIILVKLGHIWYSHRKIKVLG